MKFLSLIIASFILFLAVTPGTDALSVQADAGKTCCGGQRTPASDDDTPQDRQRTGDCDGTSCNPFHVCRCCVAGCLKVSCDCIPDPAAFSVHGYPPQTAPASPVATDVWHPPKIL